MRRTPDSFSCTEEVNLGLPDDKRQIRSSPRVRRVRSLEPMENSSKCSRNCPWASAGPARRSAGQSLARCALAAVDEHEGTCEPEVPDADDGERVPVLPLAE